MAQSHGVGIRARALKGPQHFRLVSVRPWGSTAESGVKVAVMKSAGLT